MGIKKSKFSPREHLFLELFLSGCSMKDAARGAGYRGSSDQALCNTGRAILTKFGKNPKALFRGAGAIESRIASLLLNMAVNNQSESKQLKALSILSRAMFSKG